MRKGMLTWRGIIKKVIEIHAKELRGLRKED